MESSSAPFIDFAAFRSIYIRSKETEAPMIHKLLWACDHARSFEIKLIARTRRISIIKISRRSMYMYMRNELSISRSNRVKKNVFQLPIISINVIVQLNQLTMKYCEK